MLELKDAVLLGPWDAGHLPGHPNHFLDIQGHTQKCPIHCYSRLYPCSARDSMDSAAYTALIFLIIY